MAKKAPVPVPAAPVVAAPPAVAAPLEAVAAQPAVLQYPKWVKGRIFATQAEHVAAGPSYAEEAK